MKPSMLPGSAVPGCSLVSFHFLWAILCPQAVLVPEEEQAEVVLRAVSFRFRQEDDISFRLIVSSHSPDLLVSIGEGGGGIYIHEYEGFG